MIKINLITIGKLKEKYWRDACAEYVKRLSAFCKMEIVELAESRLSDNPSEKEIMSALEQEAKAIKPYCEKKGAVNIAMCIEGEQLSSVKLSKKISGFAVQGFSTVNFIIGSSFGIAEEIKKQRRLKAQQEREQKQREIEIEKELEKQIEEKLSSLLESKLEELLKGF